jgi:hypothetical protein
MGRENLNIAFEEALEIAERDMKPLALKTDHTQHFAEEFRVSEADVAVLSNKYLSLKILGAVDKKGYALVHAGRMEVREVRIHIEKTRKRLKEESLEYGRAVDAEAKRITNMIAPVEEYLLAEEKRIDDELEAVKRAKQKELDDRNQARMDALLAVGATIGLAAVVTMDDQAYVDYLALVTKDFEARKAFEAKQAEEAEAKAKAEAEAKAKADKEIADRLEAERVANAAAKAENDRIAKELKEKMDAFNAAQAEAKAKADKEVADKLKAEPAIQAVAQKLEIEKIYNTLSDSQKLLDFAEYLTTILPPEMVTEEGKAARVIILEKGRTLVSYIKAIAETI